MYFQSGNNEILPILGTSLEIQSRISSSTATQLYEDFKEAFSGNQNKNSLETASTLINDWVKKYGQKYSSQDFLLLLLQVKTHLENNKSMVNPKN